MTSCWSKVKVGSWYRFRRSHTGTDWLTYEKIPYFKGMPVRHKTRGSWSLWLWSNCLCCFGRAQTRGSYQGYVARGSMNAPPPVISWGSWCQQNRSCVSVQGPQPSRLHSRPIASHWRDQGRAISKAPSNAAEKWSLLYHNLKDATDESFVAQPIPRCTVIIIY